MSEQRVLVHASSQRVRWCDMDMLGHVNNTVYFRFMEQARIEWTYALAGGQGYDGPHGVDRPGDRCRCRRTFSRSSARKADRIRVSAP